MPRVLVVDDEAGIRRSIRKMLERAGYEITECGDGAEALALIERASFDVILTDLHLPNFDGLALARALKALPGTKPRVVVISGSGEGGMTEIATALGAVATLSKPFTGGDLIGVVEKALKT